MSPASCSSCFPETQLLIMLLLIMLSLLLLLLLAGWSRQWCE
jgi:hypothetical protein